MNAASGSHLLASIVLGLAAASACAAAPTADRAGGKDHPLVSRYEGSLLYDYGVNPLGPAQVVERDKAGAVLRPVEGRLNNRLYWGPKGTAALAIFRNYQAALQSAGFETLFGCETVQCEKLGIQRMVQDFPYEARWVKGDPLVNILNSGNQKDFHYISARRQAGSGFTYVQVALAGPRSDGDSAGRVRQFIQVIEPAQAEMGKVTVDAKAIGAGLQRDGKIALYGVHFDTNKAVLKAESDEQLKQMAQALGTARDARVFIVGHTDNQGDFENNLGLSQRRAQAVADALSTRFGIAASRMTARGVANLAPVAPNDEEAGRARNRRVELVLR